MSPSTLPQAERLARLRLIRTDGIGPITFRSLIARYGTGVAALEAVPLLARRGGRKKPPRLASASDAEQEMEAADRLGAAHIFLSEPSYPLLLTAIEDAPPVLITKGSLSLGAERIIGMVGARNASASGRRLAGQLARDLGAAGFVVASGLARGIDTAAHDGALNTGTIAVIAGGIDNICPKENADLQEAVVTQGLLMTEAPPGAEPNARMFPRRNRIIAGLSLGVVVVEAAERSGSLITARMAGDYGREVFAVPGSPADPRAKGCNKLLREGATLVESAADVIDGLGGLSQPFAEPPPYYTQAAMDDAEPDDSDREAVRDLLSPVPTAMDILIQESGLTAPKVLTILLELELAGVVQRAPGGRVSLS